jgi:hypothetical protein
LSDAANGVVNLKRSGSCRGVLEVFFEVGVGEDGLGVRFEAEGYCADDKAVTVRRVEEAGAVGEAAIRLA